jgi:hypothetical protein
MSFLSSLKKGIGIEPHTNYSSSDERVLEFLVDRTEPPGSYLKYGEFIIEGNTNLKENKYYQYKILRHTDHEKLLDPKTKYFLRVFKYNDADGKELTREFNVYIHDEIITLESEQLKKAYKEYLKRHSASGGGRKSKKTKRRISKRKSQRRKSRRHK